MRLLSLAVPALWCSLSAPPPAIAAEWSPIDCKDSRLDVLPGATCSMRDASAAGSKSGGASRIVSKEYAARGTHQGITFNVTLHRPESISTYTKAKTSDERKESLKRFNSATREGTDWSNPERVGSALVMTFARARQNCFAFDDYGPAKLAGYAYTMSGYYCRRQPQGLTQADARDLLAKISVR